LGKGRLILDLRHVNSFVEKQKIKFEGCKQALNYAHKGNKMIKYDLKSGYFHIEIHEDFQKYLGFSWNSNGCTKFYVFAVLPFGLRVAGTVFTKVLRPLVKRWRSFGYHIIMYLDNGWASHDEYTCRLVSKKGSGRFVKRRIRREQRKKHLGANRQVRVARFYLELGKGSVEIHEKKFVALKDNISSLLYGKEVVSARNLARTVGRIISMSFALGNILSNHD
jgi:hypothetical protein